MTDRLKYDQSLYCIRYITAVVPKLRPILNYGQYIAVPRVTVIQGKVALQGKVNNRLIQSLKLVVFWSAAICQQKYNADRRKSISSDCWRRREIEVLRHHDVNYGRVYYAQLWLSRRCCHQCDVTRVAQYWRHQYHHHHHHHHHLTSRIRWLGKYFKRHLSITDIYRPHTGRNWRFVNKHSTVYIFTYATLWPDYSQSEHVFFVMSPTVSIIQKKCWPNLNFLFIQEP